MNPERKWSGISSAVVLLVGILLGVAMDRLLLQPARSTPTEVQPAPTRTPGSPAGRLFMKRLTLTLDLSETQSEEVAGIFRQYLPRLSKARKEGGDVETLRKELREEIAQVLTPGQREKYRAMKDRRNRRRER